MATSEQVDAMLMRKVSDLREKLGTDNLNPLWVEWMLQRIAENDHAGDAALRSVWITLKRPRLSEIESVLDKKSNAGQRQGMKTGLELLFRTMNWSDGPDEVELTIVTMRNLFLEHHKFQETEGTIIQQATEIQRLRMCPDWVIPAAALHAEKTGLGISQSKSVNFCLDSDQKRGAGFGMFFRQEWHIYDRTVDRHTPWSCPINWVFVKREVPPF